MKHSLYCHEMKLVTLDKQRASPFACIRAFPDEDSWKDSLFDDLIFRYVKNRIKERLDISFREYIKLPMPVARYLDKNLDRIIGPLEKQRAEQEKNLLKGFK